MKKYSMILVALLTITLAACGKNERDIYADAGEVITDTAFNELYKQLPDREDKDNEDEVTPANLKFDEDEIYVEPEEEEEENIEKEEEEDIENEEFFDNTENIVFEGFSSLYEIVGNLDYYFFQDCTRAFLREIGNASVEKVTLLSVNQTSRDSADFQFTTEKDTTYNASYLMEYGSFTDAATTRSTFSFYDADGNELFSMSNR